MKRTARFSLALATAVLVTLGADAVSAAEEPAGTAGELEIEITKKGLGKEVTLRRGAKEWFMLVEVTPDNTVVIRQEKDHDSYLVDESETHDRPLAPGEVDAVIEDFINSVKTQTKAQRK
ncbi:hypothetical protein [Candidatus Nitrospira bockiana]